MQPQKKSRGRPPIGKGIPVQVRFRPPELSSLDAFIAAQPEPRPSRPEAIRRLLAEALNKTAEVKSPALSTPSDAFLRALGHRAENGAK
jgi:hypothetical protein